MPRVAVVTAVALLSAAATADASSWPLAGGDPSRSGFSAQGGRLPATAAWTTPAPGVRTPIVVTGGGGPAVQRVAYGTEDGRVHLRLLDGGDPVGSPDGLLAADATVTDPAATFGRGTVAAGFADTSTPARLGVLHVVHADGGGIEILRMDLAGGARIDASDVSVPETLGCGVAGSPLLTPPAADGSRIMFFTIRGACPAGPALVRVPITGDAAAPTAALGQPTFARVDGLAGGADPALVVIAPADATARFYVAVSRTGGIDLYDAARTFAVEPATLAPDLTAALPAGEVPGTPSTPATADGLVAGAEGAGTPPASALYVAAEAGDVTHVHRIAVSGGALTREATAELPGLPARGLSLAQTATPSGPSPGGRLVVATTEGLSLLRADDLEVIAGHSGAGLADTVPVTTRDAVLTVRSVPGGPAQPLALRLDDLSPEPVMPPIGDRPGIAVGQGALARGLVVLGTAGHVVAYRMRDVVRPSVRLKRPRRGARLRRGRRVRLVASAADDGGVRAMAFRLRRGRQRRVVASASVASFTDRGRFSVRARVPRLRPGRWRLQAIATDAAGNRGHAVRVVRLRR